MKQYLLDISECPDIDDVRNLAKPILNTIEDSKRKIISILHSLLKNENDNFLFELLNKVKKFIFYLL